METNTEFGGGVNAGLCGMPFARVQGRIARKLRHIAESMSPPREVDPASNELSKLGAQASAWIHGAADQIERMDPAEIKRDFTAKVQRNPGSSLLIAAAAGLVLGIVVRRR